MLFEAIFSRQAGCVSLAGPPGEVRLKHVALPSQSQPKGRACLVAIYVAVNRLRTKVDIQHFKMLLRIETDERKRQELRVVHDQRSVVLLIHINTNAPALELS